MRLPLLGEIAAGAPLLAEQNVEEYLTFPGSTGGDFLLRVRGDSMIERRHPRRRPRDRSPDGRGSQRRDRRGAWPETTSRPTRRRSRRSTARTDASASSPRTPRSSRSSPSTCTSSGASSGSFASYERRVHQRRALRADARPGARRALRGASLECLVCGEFVMHARAGVVFCPECGTQTGGARRRRSTHGELEFARAGRVTAGGAEFAHRRSRKVRTPQGRTLAQARRRKPTESGTERRPPPAYVSLRRRRR